MSDDFIATCQAIVAFLKADLPRAEAFDREFAPLVPPRPKRRTNGNADIVMICDALSSLPRSRAAELISVIDDLESMIEHRAEQARENDLEQLRELQAEAEALRQKLGLPLQGLISDVEALDQDRAA